jgi:hypothetical protein
MVENSPSSEASDVPPDDNNLIPTPVAATSTFWDYASPFLALRPSALSDSSDSDDAMPEPSDPTVAATAPTAPLTMEDLLAVLSGLQSNRTAPALVSPRHGSISPTGVWTGMGASGSGLRPYSKYCMREFKTDPIKNHQHMHPIEDKCKQGLRDSPELHFSLSHEPNANSVVTSIRAFEKFINNCGMDGVFTITDQHLDTINFLQQPGLVNQQNIDDWINSILLQGVWHKDPTGTICRHPVCQHDLTNMDWSAEAVLNSCTPALRYDLENKVDIQFHNGPKLMMTLLTMLYRPSLSKLEELRDQLKGLDIRKYPGENITLFCHDASKLVCEIRMNFMKHSTVDDLTTVALTGLHGCSEELIRIKVRTISMDNDVNGFEGSVGNKKADALEVLQQMEDMYRVLVNLKAYAPAQQIDKKTLATATAYQASADSSRLVQDRNATSTGRTGSRPQGVCWDCGQSDHFRGDPKCPSPKVPAVAPAAVTPGGTTQPPLTPPRHGLDDATSAKATELATAKLLTMPPREHIPDESEYSVSVDGKIVAKYCRHCGRFVKGGSQHYTKDHTGARNRFPYKGPAPTTPSTPSVSASLANVNPNLAEPTPIFPSVDSHSYLFRHQDRTNYDFGSMGGHTAHVARLDFDDQLTELIASEDEDGLFSILVNEFGG